MSSQPRRAKRVDRTQQQIVHRLRQIGVAVEVIGYPVDLMICYRGETFPAECKSGDEPLTKAQVGFIDRWPGKVFIFRSADDAAGQILARYMT